MDVVRQFDVYWTDLEPTVGHEIKKTRPCIVVSPEAMNKNLKTIIIAPMTSKVRNYPTRVPITFDGVNGEIALDQIRSVSFVRLKKRMGSMDDVTAKEVSARLQKMFSWPRKNNH